MNKDIITALYERKNKAEAELKKICDAIKGLQEMCEHSWHYEGHSHNDSYYTCIICRAEKTE